MAQLPADRTKLTLAQANQTPGLVADATANKNALTEAYDTIDLLNEKVDTHAGASVLPHADGSVTTAKIANGAVSSNKLASGAATTDKIADSAVTTSKLAAGATIEEKIANGAVSRRTIVTGAVGADQLDPSLLQQYGNIATNAKFQQIDAQFADITQDTSITVTVGPGGSYSTINAALGYLSRKTLKYSDSGFKAEIMLKSGFVMSEQVFVKNIDLGFITISSEASEVTINAGGFVQNVNESAYGSSGFPLTSSAAFTGYGNAIMPVINVLFNFNGSGIAGQTNGIFLIYGAMGLIARGKGFKNGMGNGYSIMEGSRLYATETICSGHASNNISCFRGSYLLFRAGIATGSGGYGAYLDNACMIDCISADFSNCVQSGLWISGLSMASANRMTANNCGRNAISADSGSTIDAHNSTLNNAVQRGVSCDGSTINVNDSSITGSGQQAINVTNSGTVTAKNSTMTGSLGTESVYANYGGTCNVSGAQCQRVVGTNGTDIRVGYGGIIYAHDAVGGYSGATPNVLSNNGIIFNATAISDNTTFGANQTFTPTGDWSGTLTYSKMPNGIVWLRGTLTAGTTLTPGTNIGSIASGYRPPVTMPLQAIHGSNNTQYGFHISSSGSMFLSSTLVSGSYNINFMYKSV